VTDKELDKNAARHLAIIRHAQEITGNVALASPISLTLDLRSNRTFRTVTLVSRNRRPRPPDKQPPDRHPRPPTR
jgi:hypothetical protein